MSQSDDEFNADETGEMTRFSKRPDGISAKITWGETATPCYGLWNQRWFNTYTQENVLSTALHSFFIPDAGVEKLKAFGEEVHIRIHYGKTQQEFHIPKDWFQEMVKVHRFKLMKNVEGIDWSVKPKDCHKTSSMFSDGYEVDLPVASYYSTPKTMQWDGKTFLVAEDPWKTKSPTLKIKFCGVLGTGPGEWTFKTKIIGNGSPANYIFQLGKEKFKISKVYVSLTWMTPMEMRGELMMLKVMGKKGTETTKEGYVFESQ